MIAVVVLLLLQLLLLQSLVLLLRKTLKDGPSLMLISCAAREIRFSV